ncbi:MAG: hypothetical protein ACK2UA_03840 [Anaerolineae bacterium]|jgi:hypothetical protein
MDYGKILTRAWEITWRWKILWILGFLAALGSGSGGGGSSSYSTSNGDWPYGWGYTYHEPYIPAGVIAAIIGVACLAIIIGIAIWVVSVIARGGLIAGVQQVEDEGQTTFGSAWRAGARRFWTLFGISILAAIPLIILAVVGIIVLIVMFVGSGFAFDSSDAAGAMGIVTSILCGGVFCCGMVIVAIILQQIRLYAERAAILEDLGWIEAFARGWNVLKANIAPTIIFWIIFLVIGIVFFIAVAAVLGVTAIPFIALVANVDPGPWLIAPICCGGLVFVIVAALINAIVQTFTSATWTLAYRDMVGLSAPPAAEPAEEPPVEESEEPESEE